MRATEIVHWPGQDTPACEKHAAKLKHLGEVLGCPVSSTPTLEDLPCKNCENEEKKELERLAEL